ncbi:MAG TPA: glycosyl transferase family 1 [Bacteroidales bacterium]|nr:glycosyl transferase family 1 [Bacteroidales bacterium]HBZ20094.1 glycosyl transferase family 1 [Bacteroidales bacterium]
MTKIVHIQKSVLSTGRAPLRLHNAFLEENFDSSILTMEFDVNHTERISDTGRNSRVIARIDQFLQSFITRKINRQYGLYSYPIFGTDISKNDLVKKADIIYLHWVQGGFLNIGDYRRLAKLGKPIIVFMHDMWSITGGCHHSFSCEKYTTNCFKCQMFPKKQLVDWPKIEFLKKRRMFSSCDNLYFISPSKWLHSCSKQSALTKDKTLFHIPNIIDNKLYKPVGKRFARQILNLEENEIILSFGAFLISSAYKGWAELLKALNILVKEYSRNEITLLIFGDGYNKAIADAAPFRTRFMGFLKDELSTVLVYNATDVFVTPSLADNFPTTVLECQACGTPVVGFDVGGIPDMIKHKDNGYLAKYKDADDLANGIKFCLETKIKGRLLPEFEKNTLLKKHGDMMQAVLNN